MNSFKNQAAQGDIFIRRINELPSGLTQQQPDNSVHIVAHSETGHHHTISARNADFFRPINDDMIMFLVINEPSDLIHNRSFDTHQSIHFDKGIFEIRRQREYTPEGWRKVVD